MIRYSEGQVTQISKRLCYSLDAKLLLNIFRLPTTLNIFAMSPNCFCVNAFGIFTLLTPWLVSLTV